MYMHAIYKFLNFQVQSLTNKTTHSGKDKNSNKKHCHPQGQYLNLLNKLFYFIFDQ